MSEKALWDTSRSDRPNGVGGAPTLLRLKMRRRRIAVAALVVGMAVACTETDSPRSGAAAPGEPLFERHLERAYATRTRDEFLQYYRVTRHLPLHGKVVRSLQRVAASAEGILVTDLILRRVFLFDAAGGYVREFGSPGRNPGQLTFPTMAIDGAADRVLVSEFEPRRISEFSATGGFLRSFSYSGGFFSVANLARSRRAGTLQLIGYSERNAGTLNHTYLSDGTALESSVILPADIPPWMRGFIEPVVTRAGEPLMALSCHYGAWRLDELKKARQELVLVAPRTFRTPTERLAMVPADAQEKSLDENYRTYQEWRLSWTPIEAIALVGNELLIEYQTFDPLRYTVDVWNIANRPHLVNSFKTNYLILSETLDGELLLRAAMDGKDVANPMLLRVAKMVVQP